MSRTLSRRITQLEVQAGLALKDEPPLVIFTIPVPGDGTPLFATIAGYGQINRKKNEPAGQFEERVNKLAIASKNQENDLFC